MAAHAENPKDATPITQAQNRAVLDALPFGDTQDFEDAQRGFLRTLPDVEIKNDRGRVVWSLKEYAFLGDEQAPPTVNPSLWRQARLNMSHGLFQVTASTYQIRGFDISNMTIIEGDRGLIVIDPLISTEVARAGLDLYIEHRGSRPVTAVIYTHSHVDHFGGVRDLPARVGSRARRRTHVHGDGAAAAEDGERFLIGLARADVDGQRAAMAREQPQHGAADAGALRRRLERIDTDAKPQAFARDHRPEVLGRGDAMLGRGVAQVEDERPVAILEGQARRLQRRHAQAAAAQFLDGLLGQFEVRLGHEAQPVRLHLGAVHSDVGETVEAQPPLQGLDAPGGEDRTAAVGCRAEADERGARSRIGAQVPVRGPLRQRRIEGEEPVQGCGFRDSIPQTVRFQPQRPDGPSASRF